MEKFEQPDEFLKAVCMQFTLQQVYEIGIYKSNVHCYFQTPLCSVGERRTTDMKTLARNVSLCKWQYWDV